MIIKLPNCSVHLHDSAKQLTATRYKDFNNYKSQDEGIGSDFEAIKKRAGEVLSYFETDPTASKNAVINIYFTADSIENKINFASRAFGLLVAKIEYKNGQVFTPSDYSDQEIDYMIECLSIEGLTQELIDSKIKEVKKKSIEN